MALAKNYSGAFGGSTLRVSDLSSLVHQHHKAVVGEEEESQRTTGLTKDFSTIQHSMSNGSMFADSSSIVDHGAHLLNFKTGHDNFMYSSGSLLSFEQSERSINQNTYSRINQKDEYPNYQNQHLSYRILEELNCFQTASSVKENQSEGDALGWFYSETTDGITQESPTQEAYFHKRPLMGDSMQAPKKQCTSTTRKPKPKFTSTKDAQSIAAKNRRERISERLKILQELIPNGSKVDLVTMLEKAVSYVKFLQLQVKVLATDEFWPVQGGKAPDISQVKEAIDAIISSQRDSSSISK